MTPSLFWILYIWTQYILVQDLGQIRNLVLNKWVEYYSKLTKDRGPTFFLEGVFSYDYFVEWILGGVG